MTGIRVIFAKITPALSEPEQHRIAAALSRIAIGSPPDGRWPARPGAIVVTGILTGGRSGARVLRVEVLRESQRLSQIAKVSPLTDASDEWRAFKEIVKPTNTVLCPPIEAVTEGVLESRDALPGEDEAIVYTDVEQFAGAATSNLEDLVTAAVSGEAGASDIVVALISRLFRLADTTFYGRSRIEQAPRFRWEFSPSLGPDLRIAVEQGAIAERSHVGGQVPRPPGRPLVPGDILGAALGLPDAEPQGRGAGLLPAGSLIAVSGLTLRRDGDHLTGERDYVSLELAPAPDLTSVPYPEKPVSVHGTVTGTRSAMTWERIQRALPGIRVVAPGVVQHEHTQLAHPFAALRRLLTQAVSGLVTSYVHGDLNARNVLIADDRPYLIDYARARANWPILGDFAWLEINLLRHPLSGALSFSELVQVSRLLALGDQVASLLPVDRHADVIGALVAGCRPHVTAAIRILATIRGRARLSYAQAERSGGKAGEPWWREYAAQLILAAHRTFKWPDDLHNEATWRAGVAVAAVGSEQLTCPDSPWRLWDRPSLAATMAAVLPLLPGEAAALPVLVGLMIGLGPGGNPDLADLIQSARARIVNATLNVPEDRKTYLRNGHGIYIDIQTGPGDSPSQPPSSALSQAINADQAIVLGPSGAGKSTLLDELEYRLSDVSSGRFPVRLRASDVAGGKTGFHPLANQIPVHAPESVPPSALLSAGLVHLMIDDFNDVSTAGRAKVATWLRAIRRRFPLTRVTVCFRATDVPAELAEWTGIRLGAVTDEQIAGYLARSQAARGLPSGLIAAVLDGPDGPRLRDLARTPLLLWLLASTSHRPKPAVTAGDLVGAHIDGLETRSAVSEQCFPMAEAFADWQTESGETATLDEAFLPSADPDTRTNWDRARKQLIDLGILAADGPTTRFRLRIYRDYFAARRLQAIAATGPDQLNALVLRFRWRDSFVLFCSFSSTGPELLRQLSGAVMDADPCYAARLLRAASPRPADLVTWFTAAQERCLLDPAAGDVARARAAEALAELASPGALFRLFGVLSDAAEDPSAAELSLNALVRAVREIPPGGQRRLTIDLTLLLGRLIEAAEPPLLLAILRAIGDLDLRGLELLVAAHLRGPGPWPVIEQAHATLGKHGVLLPADMEDAWRRARRSRLVDVERELLTATSATAANELQNERFLLLNANHDARRLTLLLERRFTFEIGTLLGELIDEIGGTETRQDPDELLAAVDGTGRLTSAAAHRLLRDRPELAERLFLTLTRDGRTDWPLIAAAAAARLPAARLPDVADYFRRLLESGDESSAEALAVLAQAISAMDPLIGVRLVRRAHRYLADHDRDDRLRWPWVTAVVRFGGSAAQLDAMLSAGPIADQRLVIEALASAGFLLTAGQPSGYRFCDAARQLLLRACTGAAGGETIVLLRAAAAMGVPEALDVLFAGQTMEASLGAFDPYSASELALPGYGLIEVAATADALAAIGYLARLSADTGSTGGAIEAAHRLLRGFDLPGAHPSVAVGRLTGLGYLGDWQPVLDALEADPRMPAIARHTLELWVPDAGQASVARWILDRLAGPSLPPGIRSALLDLKRYAEERTGELAPSVQAPRPYLG